MKNKYHIFYFQCKLIIEILDIKKGSSGITQRQNSIEKQRFFSTSSSLLKPVFCSSAEEAVKDIPSGSKLLVGGKKTSFDFYQIKYCLHK